ncbi:NS2 [Great Island virus]|uniref:Non-structural protein NS2 n=1 Tax=Great Island virus TaxID=204269 RepID=E1AA96_9REOV|nr:NS2 [Great Island virus]ADM88599.1 NS2 [Great Island virus]
MSADKQIPMIRKPFTRTIVLKSTGKDDYVAKMCNALGCEYLVVRHGLGMHVAGSNTPTHGCMLLLIPGAGSFRLIDRDQSTFVVVSSDGLEVQQDRWPGMRFEAVDMFPRCCRIVVGDVAADSEIRFGSASGTVPPYTAGESMEAQDEISLPGLDFSVPDSDLREYREKLREEKEERAAAILSALRTTQQSRTLGRLHGVKTSDLVTLRPPQPPTPGRNGHSALMSSAPVPPPLVPTSSSTGSPALSTTGLKRTQKLAPPPVAESAGPTFGADSNRFIEEALEAVMQDDASGRLNFGGEPESVGLFSQNLGSFDIPPSQLPAYEIDETRNKYKYVGMRTSTRLHALACDDRVYFVPSAE